MANYYFNFPLFDDLNDSQKAAVNDTKPIGLSGGPGTGKSVVSLWRHIINHTKENPVQSQLLTFTTSLAYYLKELAKVNINSYKSVSSTVSWYNSKDKKKMQEIIVDEAQDLGIKFNELLFELTNSLSYGADNQQILAANSINIDGSYNINVCSPEDELEKFLGNSMHRLDKNYRSTQRIMLFAKHFFQNAFIHHNIIDGLSSKIGEKPRMFITGGDLEKQNNVIVNVIEQYQTDSTINIAILQPFANMPWAGTEHWTARYYFELLKSKYDCSFYDHTLKGLTGIKNIHITPFKSSKGLEFDIVIIPNIHLVNKKFDVVNWRDFYVGVTRAKSRLILISENDFPEIGDYVEKIIL
jgi:superfamily I DNA/RNA helicase